MEIPGVHMVCHTHEQGAHGDQRIILNGGWHDAGDLSQGLVNTSEAVYAMFDLAERMRARGQERELADRLVEEARWGLDWVLKNTFHDGYRVEFGHYGLLVQRHTRRQRRRSLPLQWGEKSLLRGRVPGVSAHQVVWDRAERG